MLVRGSARRVAALLLVAGTAVWLVPGVATAHSVLDSSVPAQGATVPSPYAGPIVLTFSGHLNPGSEADLVDPGGTSVAKAVVDPNAKTMTFTLTTPLAPGAWQIRWVSIADDGAVLRDIVKFTLAPAASDPATASTAASVVPIPSPFPAGTTTGSDGDVVLPIIVALIVLGAGAAYLMTRRYRPPDAS